MTPNLILLSICQIIKIIPFHIKVLFDKLIADQVNWSLVEATLTNISFCIGRAISISAEARNENKNEKHIVWLDMEVCNCCELSNGTTEERKELKGTGFFR